MVLLQRPHRQQTRLRRRLGMAARRSIQGIWHKADHRRMDSIRTQNAAACGWTEPTTAGIRTVGKGADTYTRLQMGTRTETLAEPSSTANTSVRKTYGGCTRHAAYHDCQRRRADTHFADTAQTARSRRRVPRTVARCRSGNKPRSIRLRPQNTCTHEVHAAKAVG